MPSPGCAHSINMSASIRILCATRSMRPTTYPRYARIPCTSHSYIFFEEHPSHVGKHPIPKNVGMSWHSLDAPLIREPRMTPYALRKRTKPILCSGGVDVVSGGHNEVICANRRKHELHRRSLPRLLNRQHPSFSRAFCCVASSSLRQ